MARKKHKIYTGMDDKAFKDIFLNEKNRHLLTALLEAVLKEKIDHVVVENTELITDNAHVKSKRVDAFLTANIGLVNIEVNSKNNDYTKMRNTTYLFTIYNHTTKVGESYLNNKQVIQINFTFGMRINKPEFCYGLCDLNDSKYRLLSNFKIYEFNMTYLKKLWYTNSAYEIQKYKYIMMLFLKPKELEKISDDKIVRDYMDELIKWSEAFKGFSIDNWISPEEHAQKIIASERILAEEKGMKKGIKKTAKNLLQMGTPIEQVSKATSLSIKELKKLMETI